MNILIDGQTLHTAEINRGIGTYYKEIIEAMLRNDFINSFYITIDDEKKLDCFSEYVKNKLLPLIDQNYNPQYLISDAPEYAHEKYSELINNTCINIDIYWNANPLMDNILLPEKKGETKFTCTIHDLIPYAMQDIYFKMWSKKIIDAYKNKLAILNNYDLLFPVSEYTQSDIVKYLGIDTSKQVVTLEGVDSRFKPYPFPKIPDSEQYILYIGGFDPRKNMFRAIDAFSLFIKKYNKNKIAYKLYLVCTLDDTARNKLMDYAKSRDIADSLVLTGFVEDKELLKIYQRARCFFFPSLYEGFGLPILEALASGLPVASANNSSLPEVAKNHANYFNAYDIEEMALSLKKVLNESVSLKERISRYQYALQFTWEQPARLLLEGMFNLDKKKKSPKRKKIAWVSPFPPQRSGISSYSRILLLAMKKDIDIDIYYDEILPEKELVNIFNSLPLEKLADNFDGYDEVIYHLGNNTKFHINIYKYSWNYPSTVVIHDWNILPFMQHSFLDTDDIAYYEDAIKVYGKEGEEELDLLKKRGYPDVWKFSMSDAIAQRSKRVIVHHQWVKNQFLDASNVDVIPLFSHIEREPTVIDIWKFRDKYSISENEFLVTTFGDINLNKLPDIQIKAIKALIEQGYPVKLIFAGTIQPETKILFDQLKGTIFEKKIMATDYLINTEYFSCLYASDTVINLRKPTMGEASLTLAEALYAGKPVIIGDINQYKEFPEGALVNKIQYGHNEVEQLIKIIKKVLENTYYRNKIKKKAKLLSNNLLSIDKVIMYYFR